MKIKTYLFACTIFFLLLPSLQAQKRFVLQNRTRFEVWPTVDSVITRLQPGDTAYLPGGNFDIGSWVISNSNTTIMGVGFFEDSIQATGHTFLNGSIQIQDADNVTLSGFWGGDITTSSTSGIVQNLRIERCNVGDITLHGSAGTPGTSGALIMQNIIRGDLNGGYTESSLISNNYLMDEISNFNGTNGVIFSNNFINKIGFFQGGRGTTYVTFNLSHCVFTDNILRASTIANTSGGYFFGSATSNFGTGNSLNTSSDTDRIVGSNEFKDNHPQVIFDNRTAGEYPSSYTLIESGEYSMKLQTSQPEVGPYYGQFAIPPGWLPRNPHIRRADIATQTDENGNLSITIDVSSQN